MVLVGSMNYLRTMPRFKGSIRLDKTQNGECMAGKWLDLTVIIIITHYRLNGLVVIKRCWL